MTAGHEHKCLLVLYFRSDLCLYRIVVHCEWMLWQTNHMAMFDQESSGKDRPSRNSKHESLRGREIGGLEQEVKVKKGWNTMRQEVKIKSKWIMLCFPIWEIKFKQNTHTNQKCSHTTDNRHRYTMIHTHTHTCTQMHIIIKSYF